MGERATCGRRIGDWFLWLDTQTATVGSDQVVIVTARRAIINGDVLARELGSREMALALREAARQIDDALNAIDKERAAP